MSHNIYRGHMTIIHVGGSANMKVSALQKQDICITCTARCACTCTWWNQSQPTKCLPSPTWLISLPQKALRLAWPWCNSSLQAHTVYPWECGTPYTEKFQHHTGHIWRKGWSVHVCVCEGVDMWGGCVWGWVCGKENCNKIEAPPVFDSLQYAKNRGRRSGESYRMICSKANVRF